MDNGRKVILYHSPQTRSSGSLILLEELGAPYELHALNMKAGEQRRPAYLAINPIAKVPALIDRSLKREPAPPQGSSYGDDNTMLDTLTAELAKGPYLLGEPFSAADVLWDGALKWTTRWKLVPELPVVAGYLQRVGSRPAVAKVEAMDAELLRAHEAALSSGT